MNSRTPMKILPLLVGTLLASNTPAGTLDPVLEEAIADMAPGDVVDVIIRCVDPLDPASVPADELVPALKNKAAACETSLTNVLENMAFEPPETLWIINGIAASVPVAALNGLVHRAGVESIYLNETVGLPPSPEVQGAPGDPPLTYWNLEEIRAPDLWALGHYGTGVVVATMDTGVDADHADIGPQWRGGANSWYDPHGVHAEPFDADGHGTGVMGLIVGGNTGGFDMGVAPDAEWIAVKLFDDMGESDFGKIHQGFQWLLDPDGNGTPDDAPDIVNSSWVLQRTEDECIGEFADDIGALRAAHIAVVFSAGNTGDAPATSMAPANDPAVLSVGAIDDGLRVTSFSSRGPSACDQGIYPKVAAPGKDVLTAGLTSGGANPTAYAFSIGTSFAAPHVAGAMAVLKGAFPDMSTDDIASAIEAGAFDLDALGPDNDSGAGVVDLVAAYFVLDSSPPAPADSDQDGVPDGSDLCPGTPAEEDANTDGCSASQLDGDGDGVSDSVDQCPGTPANAEVDSLGCAVPVDGDGDGFSADLDCDDADASIYPGAREVKNDGIDQDCDGADKTSGSSGSKGGGRSK